MSKLPKNDLPTFTTQLPSTGKDVVYRPFRVKEQRNLMVAINEDKQEVYRVMKLVVNDCTFGKLDIENLPNFDVEYLFLQIRIKSIGDALKVDLTCPNCSFIETKEVMLSNVEVRDKQNIKSIIEISPSFSIKTRYPTLEELGLVENDPSSDNVFTVIRNCIQEVYTEEEVIKRDEFTDAELKEWLEDFTDDQFSEIESFIINAPYISLSIPHDCPKCKTHVDYTMRGIQSFFE